MATTRRCVIIMGVMVRRLGSRVLPALAPVLVAAIGGACAQGSDADPGDGNPDAANLEASTAAPRDASGTEPDPEDDGGTMDGGGTGVACAAALDDAKWDFEANDQGWTHVVSDNAEGTVQWPFDPWTRGTSTTMPCPDGKCWGSELAQNYAQCQRGELISPQIDLSACSGEKVKLVFRHAYAFWMNGPTWFDGGIVELSKDDGATWQVPSATYPGTLKIRSSLGLNACVLPDQFHVDAKTGFTGAQTAPSAFEIEVPAGYLTTKLRVRFSQASGISSGSGEGRNGTAAGWRIDDVHFAVK
ncbi:MAG: hypothetical protein K0S65_6821 [Labilithrix sp.]|nr:hypothetical protein [Labilithrix sp.]